MSDWNTTIQSDAFKALSDGRAEPPKPAPIASDAADLAREVMVAVPTIKGGWDTAYKIAEHLAARLALSAPPVHAGERVAWLIEAPGTNYLAVRTLGRPEFYWTPDPNKALRFFTKQDADQTAMAVRRMEPDLWGFALTLGEAWPREHKWLCDHPASGEDVERLREKVRLAVVTWLEPYAQEYRPPHDRLCDLILAALPKRSPS